MNFAALTKELPASDEPYNEDYIIVLFRDGVPVTARAPHSPHSVRRYANMPGMDWRWGKIMAVLAPEADAQHTEQLRRLQEQVAAKDAVIAHVHEYTRANP
jgi:hypothetical protein